jgi:excisionase family DNA binding protein
MTATRRVNDTLLTIQEAAQVTGFSTVSLYRWARTGRVPARKVGRNIRFSQHDLDAWITGLRSAGT